MKSTLETLIQEAIQALFGVSEARFAVEYPAELAHGDFATNAALVIAKAVGKSPREVAEAITAWMEGKDKNIAAISVAGPGFINFSLDRAYISAELAAAMAPTYGHGTDWAGRRVMVEYTQPNPFKPFHIGHLMTNTIGEATARIIAAAGGSVIRANYQGDVGPHVAKALYGLMQKGKPDEKLPLNETAQYIGECYVYGNTQYEENEEAKKEIDTINRSIYERSDEAVNELYDWGRKVTLEAFEEIYAILGTQFDYYFFESEMAPKGKEIVKAHIGKVFEESDGAIVFHGEKFNPKLHTRVFITKADLPTYEAKEIGLTATKFEKERLDASIVITAVEQKDYQAVVIEAIRQLYPHYAAHMSVLAHGMMRFAEGKMSSRKGNVVTGESLIRDAQALAQEKMKDRDMDAKTKAQAADSIAVGAIKYAILRQGIGGDIIYDAEQSVSLEGDSGPYLQYTATRARSVMQKAADAGIRASVAKAPEVTYEIERVLQRFPSIVSRAAQELEPHHIATYLTDVAARFNSFYATEQIADPADVYAPYKLAIATAVHTTLVEGLHAIGISVPEKM